METDLNSILQELGFSLTRPRDLAAAVKQLSDYYIANPTSSTPWRERWAQAAYLVYFDFLNCQRIGAALSRVQQVGGFSGLGRYVDFGSGLGSTSAALTQANLGSLQGTCIEKSLEAQKLHRRYRGGTNIGWQCEVNPRDIDAETLVIWSYSFTELTELPHWADRAGALLIIEPATSTDGRRLQALRQRYLDAGWHVWAPCTHAKACPLLLHSERDWCHDRVSWSPPEWYLAIEQHLPMQNRTLPFSYLFLRRVPPPNREVSRLTGDLQEFKGFAKQLVCRSDRREFLSYQKKHFKDGYPDLRRGELIYLASDSKCVGNEIRVQEAPQKCDVRV